VSAFTQVKEWSWWEERFPAEVVEVMKAIVSQDAARELLTMPFIRNNEAVATNGKVLGVWAAEMNSTIAVCETMAWPNTHDVLERHRFGEVKRWYKSSEIVLPDPLPEPEPAPEPVECEKCEGEGYIECGECGHLDTCKECKGRCVIGQEKLLTKAETIQIGSMIFEVACLRSLGAEWEIGLLDHHDGPFPPPGFLRLVGGGVGRISGMRPVTTEAAEESPKAGSNPGIGSQGEG
jgi:hypothetical protein